MTTRSLPRSPSPQFGYTKFDKSAGPLQSIYVKAKGPPVSCFQDLLTLRHSFRRVPADDDDDNADYVQAGDAAKPSYAAACHQHPLEAHLAPPYPPLPAPLHGHVAVVPTHLRLYNPAGQLSGLVPVGPISPMAPAPVAPAAPATVAPAPAKKDAFEAVDNLLNLRNARLARAGMQHVMDGAPPEALVTPTALAFAHASSAEGPKKKKKKHKQQADECPQHPAAWGPDYVPQSSARKASGSQPARQHDQHAVPVFSCESSILDRANLTIDMLRSQLAATEQDRRAAWDNNTRLRDKLAAVTMRHEPDGQPQQRRDYAVPSCYFAHAPKRPADLIEQYG